MSRDYISEIDDLLDESLPDGPGDIDDSLDEKQKEEMTELLQHAADELGKSPTIREFRELDFETSVTSIRRAFGTWNDAKREAGLETRQRGIIVEINEDYFSEIDSSEKAYWLGTLIANSSLNKQEIGDSYALQVGRAEKYEYFVRRFADAIDSHYSINKTSKNSQPNDDDVVLLQISNPTFLDNVISAGYPKPDESIGGFPWLIEEYLPAFVRGYLESSGYFSTGGWGITAESLSRAQTLQHLFEEFGAKRPTISEKGRGAATVRVSNIFDIRSVFETCWPDQLETDPSWTPYPQKIIDHLEEEYPYPENVSYLSG